MLVEQAYLLESKRCFFRHSCPVAMVKLSLCNALRLVVDMSVFRGSHRSVESADPQFTMRRKMDQLREELELVEQLRHV